MIATQAATQPATKNALSLEEIDVNPWLPAENCPHEVEVSLARNGFAQTLHFTQEDATELRNQLNEALNAIEVFKGLTEHRSVTAIMIGQ